VWENLQKIPYGQTDSYMGLAKKMKNTLAIRAIASANGANTLAIIIPCHRIIGSNGDLVGYAGGLSTKKKLLQLENNSQTNLFE
jgi:methylated-DNA-[protein]-cysteine S-methyltransferase